ncbi:sugar phosphate isomerase/epimerase family protein [Streptomyces sp. NPDC048248]|uniref:sugar phosphate isomerase/epimerase family protein n=1 Tax=Streptomyces sp. NPDC048248 TaxID=3365523 RepID=UPI00371302EB
MKLGIYTAVLHDLSLEGALSAIASLGLTGAEINAGGFLPTPHLPVEKLLSGALSPEAYLKPFAEAGIELTGLNVNGNPLDPDPVAGPAHAADLRRAIQVAGLLGIRRVVTMSGLPAAEPGGAVPAWNVNPWHSAFLDSLTYQWDTIAVPFWRDIEQLAAAHGVKVCIEMHPQNLVFNPATLKRLVERTDATHIGAELDPSHLFWQGIDPVAAIEDLGPLVFHAAAKDTRINAERCRVNGVLDDRFTKVTDDPVQLGGHHTLNRWPQDSTWDFVAVGRGHDEAFWGRFLDALHRIDPDMAVNIEHEDTELGQMEGLEVAARTLLHASGATAPGDRP